MTDSTLIHDMMRTRVTTEIASGSPRSPPKLGHHLLALGLSLVPLLEGTLVVPPQSWCAGRVFLVCVSAGLCLPTSGMMRTRAQGRPSVDSTTITSTDSHQNCRHLLGSSQGNEDEQYEVTRDEDEVGMLGNGQTDSPDKVKKQGTTEPRMTTTSRIESEPDFKTPQMGIGVLAPSRLASMLSAVEWSSEQRKSLGGETYETLDQKAERMEMEIKAYDNRLRAVRLSNLKEKLAEVEREQDLLNCYSDCGADQRFANLQARHRDEFLKGM